MATPANGEGPLGKTEAEALAASLAEELTQHWRQGEHLHTEDLLALHPELWHHPEAVADLIYEEISLRQECGEAVPTEEVLGRFPQWRTQLAILLDCQRLLGPAAPPVFPAAGELLGDFLLLAELGRGGQGRVFLARQASLSDRLVVLKVAPRNAREHLSLARLQHTFIVPLYSVEDHVERGLRALCMPYFGGATLAQLVEALEDTPPVQRTGQDLLDALDRIQATAAVTAPVRGGARQSLAQASYVQAVCLIGACLAEALQYAHDRGLVHLDLKPSNVLLTADGQPMLLDFHVAREPIATEGPVPQWLGGTVGYMSPEQHAALRAVQLGRAIPAPVDGRSDVYSLGVVLYEALAGTLPPAGEGPRLLRRCNPEVSVGLADILAKCLADDPRQRYPSMAALGSDLRRHLANQPLGGVRNRSLTERWRKWRRRWPNASARGILLLAVLAGLCAAALGIFGHFRQCIDEARAALSIGQSQMSKGHYTEAVTSFRRGISLARSVPLQGDLLRELQTQEHLAENARIEAERILAVGELHRLADQVRFLCSGEFLPPEAARRLEACCRTFWANRGVIVGRLDAAAKAASQHLRDDLLDLAILWADLMVRLAPAAERDSARQEALTVLAQAEALCGPSPVLDQERRLHTGQGGGVARPPRTAWDHYALGRALLRVGDLRRAAAELERAVRLQPQALWPNFYQGMCAYRLGYYEDAVTAFSVCIGAAPEAAGCFHNRALAHAALGLIDRALDDYDQALRLDPTLGVAVLNRGMLHSDAKRYAEALADLQRALDLGVDPAVVHYDLALVNLARGNRSLALTHLGHVLQHRPGHEAARKLQKSLQPDG